MNKPKTYKEERPWGGFSQFTHNEKSTVKILRADAGKKNSLQLHHHRSELWIALDDNAMVTLGDKTWNPKRFEEIFLPVEQKHRLGAKENSSAYVLEISLGDFDENDIVRLEDDYSRA